MDASNGKNGFALVRRSSSAVEKTAPGAKRILSGMVTDAIALVKKKAARIVILDENPYPVELMELAIKRWFKTVEIKIFADRSEGLQEITRLNPDLLIVELVNNHKLDYKTLQMLADTKVTYPIVVTCGLEEPRLPVNSYATKGLNVSFLLKPFTLEPFLRILEAKLKIFRDSI